MSGFVSGYEEGEHEDKEGEREQEPGIEGDEREDRHCGDGLDRVPPCQHIRDLILHDKYHAHSKLRPLAREAK